MAKSRSKDKRNRKLFVHEWHLTNQILLNSIVCHKRRLIRPLKTPRRPRETQTQQRITSGFGGQVVVPMS
eukprot:11470895-Ditylum_brightwellii.AAC.1